MRFIYSFRKRTFFPLVGNSVEIRTDHSIFGGFIKWTTEKKLPENLTA